MRVRYLVREPKQIETDSGWQAIDLPPRHAPLFVRTTPIRAGWRWRSARAIGLNNRFILLAKINPLRDKWQAILMVLGDDGPASAVARLEYHGSHPGLHAHADCRRGGVESGTASLDDLERFPKAGAGSHHRRQRGWSENGFWEAAKRFFRMQEMKGPLL